MSFFLHMSLLHGGFFPWAGRTLIFTGRQWHQTFMTSEPRDTVEAVFCLHSCFGCGLPKSMVRSQDPVMNLISCWNLCTSKRYGNCQFTPFHRWGTPIPATQLGLFFDYFHEMETCWDRQLLCFSSKRERLFIGISEADRPCMDNNSRKTWMCMENNYQQPGNKKNLRRELWSWNETFDPFCNYTTDIFFPLPQCNR